MTLIQEFVKHLKDNNALEAFQRNVDEDMVCLMSESPLHWIDSAFIWKKTTEGSEFWNQVAVGWDGVLIMRSNIKK